MDPSYPWYCLVTDESLEQGDLLMRFPVVVPEPISPTFESELVIDAKVQEFDVVVLTQSCDLSQGKTENVLVCPIFAVEKLSSSVAELAKPKGRQKVKRGEIVSLHAIPPCVIEGHNSAVRIVNFKQVWTMPLGFVHHHAKLAPSRVRLLPPYREHLAQAFARFIMRVGLPVDFPDF